MRHSASRVPVLSCMVLLACVSADDPAAAQVDGLTGTIVVVNKGLSTATILDVATGRALAALPTGPGPHEVALTSDGTLAVVTDYNPGSSLTVIDVPGRRVVRTVDMYEYRQPHGIVFLPGDSLVVVTSEATRSLVIVNVRRGEIRRAIGTTHAGSHMVGVVADGSVAWTGDMGDNTVSRLDLRAGTHVQSFDVPQTPEAISVTPDGTEVWVGSNGTGRVSVVDPGTGSITTAAEGLGWPYRIRFTPDVRTVLLPDLRGEELRILDRETHQERARLPFPGEGPQGITVTPDGRHAFLSLSRGARIAIIDIAAGTVAGYLPAGDTPDGIVYTTRVFAGN
jgi:DNA-binding beta-propeller fold protein YncE